MIDTEKLNKAITDKGITKKHIAFKMGITTASLIDKIANRKQFKNEEMNVLRRELNLSDSLFLNIFFNPKVDKLSTNPKERA